jgi:chromosome segregation ATPase
MFNLSFSVSVRELQDEVDENKEKSSEFERDREQILHQLQAAKAKADSEALSRRVAEEDIAELEKEKMMIELELKDVGSKHRADARNLEMQLATLKDTESDLLQKIDQLSRDNVDLQVSCINYCHHLSPALNQFPIFTSMVAQLIL